MKLIIALILVIFGVVIVVKFKWFFITLAIIAALGAIAYIAFRTHSKKKAESTAELSEAATNKEIAAPKGPETIVKEYEVTGVVFYLKNLLSMMEPNYLWDYKKQDLIDTCNYDVPIYKTTISEACLTLSHEPDNPHDPNAIMVLLNDKLVGYIAAKDCKHVLKLMNNDLVVSMTCNVRGGKYKMVVEEYDFEKDRSKYSMEHGEDEYGITIIIREKIE